MKNRQTAKLTTNERRVCRCCGHGSEWLRKYLDSPEANYAQLPDQQFRRLSFFPVTHTFFVGLAEYLHESSQTFWRCSPPNFPEGPTNTLAQWLIF